MLERINKIFSNKVLYLAISIVAAITLWVYVTNIDNQNTDTTIFGIDVNFTGKEALFSKGYVIDETYNYSVSLNVLGRRDVISKLKSSNITINVDVSDINSPGSFDKFYSISLPTSVNQNEVYILKKMPEYVTVMINKHTTKSISVKGEFTGTLKAGYEAKPLEFSPSSVKVSGPESIVSRIAYAYVKVTQTDLSRTIKQKIPYIFVDYNGAEVPMDRLTVSSNTVEANMPVILTKKIPLTLMFKSGGGATEKNIKYTVEPQTITLSGDPETLEKINEISLKNYNIADITSAMSETLNIPIPNGLTNVSGSTKANVKVSVEGLNTKDILVSNIKIINVYAGHKATLVTKEINITLRGEPSVLAGITGDNINVIVDLNELGQSVGKYSVPAKVTVSDTDKVGAIGTYTAVVTLEAT